MRFDIMTLFPDLVSGVLSESIIGRAQKSGKIQINIVNIRDYTEDKHLKCDDYPFGGGAGMVMMAPPIGNAIEAIDPEHKARRIYMSPKGQVFKQQKVFELLEHEHLILLCGHYEGVDQRVIDEIIDEEISIGDYVVTGGEIPACIVIDAVSRLIDGVLASSECYEGESVASGILEYPQYTKPRVFEGLEVPEVLVNGNHALQEKWRREQSVLRTKQKRPDLYAKAFPDGE